METWNLCPRCRQCWMLETKSSQVSMRMYAVSAYAKQLGEQKTTLRCLSYQPMFCFWIEMSSWEILLYVTSCLETITFHCSICQHTGTRKWAEAPNVFPTFARCQPIGSTRSAAELQSERWEWSSKTAEWNWRNLRPNSKFLENPFQLMVPLIAASWDHTH